jgi:hypothetical protein
MCTTARLTLRRVFRFLALATVPSLLVYPIPLDSMVQISPNRLEKVSAILMTDHRSSRSTGSNREKLASDQIVRGGTAASLGQKVDYPAAPPLEHEAAGHTDSLS